MRLGSIVRDRRFSLALLLLLIGGFVGLRIAGVTTQAIRAVALPVWLFTLAAWGAFMAGERGDLGSLVVGALAFVLGMATVTVPTFDPLIGLGASVLMFAALHIWKKPTDSADSRP